MKLRKFSKNDKQKKIMISAIIGLILLVGGITLYRTFALYEEKKEFNVLRGRVPAFSKGNGDIELAVLIDGESSTEFPDKNSDAIVESITCDNGATGTWDYQTWSINIGNLSKSKTTCTLSFKLDMIKKLKSLIGSESEVQTVDEFLLNSEDVDKLIVSTDGMNYIIENTILKDLIKNSTNYTTAIAKKLLSSEAISEEAKYNAGLPCYLYKNGNNIFGGFTAKANISNPYNWGKEMGTYYHILSSWKDSIVTAFSNNMIDTKPYNYVEMQSGYGLDQTYLSGTATLGFSDNQNVNSYSIKKSETFTTSKNSTLTLDISQYKKEGRLKISLLYGAQDTDYSVSFRLSTVALY